ncbi:lectin-like domain-containing protein [Candidatus Enterococcus ferrettii]|uniref:Uncharacterized protein n=1 Tax=Candidatus Enterococcus ferrettii TaxID=2815324 RepID=A0ABV0EN18_9ENTE|nr:hypothetical protein [Enterococcus sp. 665A]MBO1339801.1 hypothetical protein [Enterococcus sp. 665A]
MRSKVGFKRKIIAFLGILPILVIATVLNYQDAIPKKIEASTTIVKEGEFRLYAEPIKDNQISLSWEEEDKQLNQYEIYESIDDSEFKVVNNSVGELEHITEYEDRAKPGAPEIGGVHEDGTIRIELDAKDEGTNYQWFLKAHDNQETSKTSDIITSTLVDGIDKYYYEISDSSKNTLLEEVKKLSKEESKKSESISEIEVNKEINNSTKSNFTIKEGKKSQKYIHALVVDKAGNISEVSSKKVADLFVKEPSKVNKLNREPRNRNFSFAIERTGDEARFVDIQLGVGLDGQMEVLEIRIPKNMSRDSSNALPNDWAIHKQIGDNPNYDSIVYIMGTNGSSNTIIQYLEAERLTINNPTAQSGEMQLLFYEHLKEVVTVNRDNFLNYFELLTNEISDSNYDETSGIFTYTQDSVGRQGGFHLRNRVLFDDDFTLTGRVNLGNKFFPTGGGDGIGFVFHPGNSNRLGLTGGGLGMAGIPDAFGFGLDTFANIEDEMIGADPPRFHEPPNPFGAFMYNEPPGGKKLVYDGEDSPAEAIVHPNNSFVDFNITFNSNDRTLSINYENSNWLKSIDTWISPNVDSYAFSSQGSTGASTNLQQFEMGSFEFTQEIEFSEENTNNISAAADVPQKINIQAYTERFGRLQRFAQGDILYDQQLRIGAQITAQPNDFELFTFLEHRDRNGEMTPPIPRPLGDQYTVTKNFQEGAFIYANRQVMLHVRQVVLEPENQLVNPEEGYLNLKTSLFDVNSGNYTEDTNQLIQVQIPSQNNDEVPDFETFAVSTKHMTDDGDLLRLNLILPEFYEYRGHFFTQRHLDDPMGADHQGNMWIDGGELVLPRGQMDWVDGYFITLYISPTEIGRSPQPYSWDYKKNDLGEIKTE